MSSVVADTHALIWYIVDPGQLSAEALAAFERATTAGDFIYLSAISIVEICYLVEKWRLPAVVLERLMEVINNSETAVVVIPVDASIGLAIRRIARSSIPDMPDRIIAATALHLSLPLVTRDAQIRAASEIQTIW